MECERSDPSDPLRQGDIVAAQPTTEDWNNPWSRFGVILSADCDLAQGTTGPSLVYVPIVSHYTYLADVWLPAEAGQLVARGREMIDKRLADFDAKMSYRHLNAWGESGGAANIITRLGERLNSRATEVMPPKKTGRKLSKEQVAKCTLIAIPHAKLTDAHGFYDQFS